MSPYLEKQSKMPQCNVTVPLQEEKRRSRGEANMPQIMVYITYR